MSLNFYPLYSFYFCLNFWGALQQKVIILRELLDNDRNISELSEEYGVNPNLIYRRKKQLFEEAVEIFKTKTNKNETKKDREIKKLKEEFREKFELNGNVY